MEWNISGIYFILFVSFVLGLSNSPKDIRTGRSLSDALVLFALSESPLCPDPPGYFSSPILKIEKRTRWPPRPEKGIQPERIKMKPGSGDVPEVEIVKSIEMEFDDVLNRLVPVRETPRKAYKSKKSKLMGEMPLLTEKTFTDLREIILKFENEKKLRNRGLTEVKNFQTGSFKLGKLEKWKGSIGGSPQAFPINGPLRSGGRGGTFKILNFNRPDTGDASSQHFGKANC